MLFTELFRPVEHDFAAFAREHGVKAFLEVIDAEMMRDDGGDVESGLDRPHDAGLDPSRWIRCYSWANGRIDTTEDGSLDWNAAVVMKSTSRRDVTCSR